MFNLASMKRQVTTNNAIRVKLPKVSLRCKILYLNS